MESVRNGMTGATMTLHENPASVMARIISRRARGDGVPGSICF
ncbi:Uncharacterised protein [Mycobacteroides abscessus subsp. abscessus]|nr:Uncharacterised protein [Mycobacteroides abscessus subsp. abscessus]